jgi:hypothetical protein
MESAMTDDVITVTKTEISQTFQRWERECDRGSDLKNAIHGAKNACDGDADFRAARSTKLFMDYLAEVQS